ncbi:hypothetical protein HZ326_27850 [Fusarium oxysporum f. sp. albedinis]|nr:hypothetical protein HZ326_28870 [Fusarium oxysporum f. sp. albedinis]KAJ0129054.1 hypothetical protein HZ326_27850 [Fusarium oxysporum f. sp. albedinis]
MDNCWRAVSSASQVPLQAIICLIFVRRQAIIRMALYPSLGGRWVMKSIDMCCQARSGTGRGLRTPCLASRAGLDLRQVWQFLTHRSTNDSIPGQ